MDEEIFEFKTAGIEGLAAVLTVSITSIEPANGSFVDGEGSYAPSDTQSMVSFGNDEWLHSTDDSATLIARWKRQRRAILGAGK